MCVYLFVWDLTWVAQVLEVRKSVARVKRSLSVAIFTVGVVHLIGIHDENVDDDDDDDAEEDEDE